MLDDLYDTPEINLDIDTSDTPAPFAPIACKSMPVEIESEEIYFA